MSQNNETKQCNKMQDSKEFSESLEGCSDEILHLEKMLANQQRVVEQMSQHLTKTQNYLEAATSSMEKRRSKKWYKLLIAFRRVKKQLFSKYPEDRRDFFCWVYHNLTKILPLKKRSNQGYPLMYFDMYDYEYQVLTDLLHMTEQNMYLHLAVDTKHTLAKRGRRFFIFAGVPYYDVGGGQRFAQIANVLNNMGHTVFYIYGFESAESKREKMYIPCVRHICLNDYSVEDMAMDLQDGDVLIFEIPYGKFKPYMDYANAHGNPTVYEHVDNWDSSLGCMFYDKNDFEEFIRDVKHITVTARVLGEKIEEAGRADYIYCPNAVDSSLFEPTRSYELPEDLVVGNRTLLYFGSLWGEWFDWDLVVHVANNCDCEINLIGDYQPIANKIKTLPKNIHFLGLKKHDDLPAYLHYSDIALLPFKNSIIGKYVSPLKIFEYIAMNKPVLGTPLDDIMGYPNVVLSEDKYDWERAVNEGIPAVDATVFTAGNSWYARCNQILEMIGREEKQHPSMSIIILNRNNMNVIFRCVDSLLAFSDSYQAEIIVVDNASTDGSYEKLVEEYGNRIKVVKNERNGCACGRNLGVKHATGEMLLFLDSDQWVIGGHYMDAAFEVLEKHSNVGAVGWAAGWFTENNLGGPIVDYLPNRGIKGPWVMCRTDIAYLGSGGLLMKKSLFQEIGGFDEFYDPTCFEDTDISLKIRDAGFELAYCPYTAIMHLPHQTTNSGSKQHTLLMDRNGEYFMNKWKEKNPKLLEYYYQ